MKHRLAVAVSFCVVSTAWAKVVWRGDFETGNLSQYTRTQMVSADRLQVVQSPVRQGKYALKATVKQGDNPINASGNRNELVYTSNEPENSEYYYKWNVQFASNYPSAKTWQLFAQWHHYGCCGSPPIQFVVNGETMYLSSVGTTVWQSPLLRGRWLDFVFHVKWSPKSNVGFIEMWVDGKLVVPKRFVATQFPGQVNYLKVGLYRNSTIVPDGVVFHDGWMQATTLEDVMPSTTTTTASTSTSTNTAPLTSTPTMALTDVTEVADTTGTPDDAMDTPLDKVEDNSAPPIQGCSSTTSTFLAPVGFLLLGFRRKKSEAVEGLSAP